MGNSPFGDTVAAARLSTYYGRDTWIEGGAEQQLRDVAGWPGMRAVAGFPDLHPGRYGPVGAGFLADRIYPQLVGPDIGCGMALYRLELPRRKLKLDRAAARLRVLEAGAGAERARSALAEAGLRGILPPDGLGTIGGGNHFCEVQAVDTVLDADRAGALGLARGDLCLLVHSGSRGRGAKVFASADTAWKQGYPTETEAALSYIGLHDAAVAWARLNRALIAEAAARALRTGATLLCDAPHNLVTREGDLWRHAKGAAIADRGLAPLAGSREARSFLLAARPEAPFEAMGLLSHGAGRRYDRGSMHGRVAKTRSSLASMTRNAFGGQVICEDRDLMIEEAGLAYKDPAQVVGELDRHRLASPVVAMTPLLTYKTARTEGRA